MPHNCFISYKKEDSCYKDEIVKKLGNNRVLGNSLEKYIDEGDIDATMRYIRKNYLKNTTVTLYLIGEHSSENEGVDENGRNKNALIMQELQATLYNSGNYLTNALLGIVLPPMVDRMYGETYFCEECQCNHQNLSLNDKTVVREFSKNFWLNVSKSGCKSIYTYKNRFCILVEYDEFMKNSDKYINEAFDKLNEPICKYVKWKDLR